MTDEEVVATCSPDDLVFRTAGRGDAEALSQLTWRTWGDSYSPGFYYRPDELGDVLESDDFTGWMLAAPDGDAVAFLSLELDRPGSRVAKGDSAMVDPRYRGHRLLASVGREFGSWASERQLLGIVGEAVTSHTRTQGDRPITGILLGFVRPLTFNGIATPDDSSPEAVALTYLPVAAQEAADVFVPDADRDIVERIYAALGLERTIASPAGDGGADSLPTGEGAATSTIDVVRKQEDGWVKLIVDVVTPGCLHLIASEVTAALDDGFRVVYVEVPLVDRGTPTLAAELEELGFFFGGVIPHLRPDGDALIYQRIGDLPITWDHIHLASPLSHDVLDHIRARCGAAP